MTRTAPAVTHSVFNQARVLKDFNFFRADSSLKRAVAAFGVVPEQVEHLDRFGAACGTLMNAAERAEKNVPKLRQFDAQGRRVDVVDYHPDYAVLMSHGLEAGCASYGYNHSSNTKGSHVARAGLIYMENQLEPGHCCPIVMTSAGIPVLRRVAELDGEFVKKLSAMEYDGRDVPITEKKSATCGMSMTEKQGGR